MTKSVETNPDPRYNSDIEIKRYFNNVKDEIDTTKENGAGNFNKISTDKQDKVLIRSGEGQNKNIDFCLNIAFTRALLQAIGNQVAKQINPEAQSVIKQGSGSKIIFNQDSKMDKQEYQKLFIPFIKNEQYKDKREKILYYCFKNATHLYNPNLWLQYVHKNNDQNSYDKSLSIYLNNFMHSFQFLSKEDQKKIFEVIANLLADQALLALPDRKHNNMAIDKDLNAIHIDLDGYHIGGKGENAKFSKLFSKSNNTVSIRSNHLFNALRFVLQQLVENDKGNNKQDLIDNILYKSFNKKYDNLKKSFEEGKLLDLLIKEAIIYKDENLSDEEFAQKIQENLSNMFKRMEEYYSMLSGHAGLMKDEKEPQPDTPDVKRTVVCIPKNNRCEILDNLCETIKEFKKKYLNIDDIKKLCQVQKRKEFLTNVPGKDVLLTKKVSSKDYENNVKKDINIENILIQYKKDNEKENNLKRKNEIERKSKTFANIFLPEKTNQNKLTINENKKKISKSALPLQQTNTYENNDDFAGIKFKLKKTKKQPIKLLDKLNRENQNKQKEQPVKIFLNPDNINKKEQKTIIKEEYNNNIASKDAKLQQNKEKISVNINDSMFNTKVNFRKPTFLNNLKFNQLNQCYNKQMAKNNNNVPDFNIHQSRYNSVFHNFC